MKTATLFLVSLVVIGIQNQGFTQDSNFLDSLMIDYDSYKESSLDKRRIKHSEIMPLVDNLVTNKKFKIQTVGKSIEGRELKLISLGNGDTDIFLWSQMHGDEPTATQAIFDIINFFNSKGFESQKQNILENTTIHFLPMLNPDGAEKFTRRNALAIDINRDALRLQSPESESLKRLRDSINPEFGFNLHDQSIYYNAEGTSKPATISFLAPAFNYEKDINEVRKRAMQVIVYMNRDLQKLAPGQVGRYNDDFEPRAFGDNIQKWGTSTILIESGGYKDDVEKQQIRKLNFASILSAIQGIATGDYKAMNIDDYELIPNNDRKLFDLKITKVSYTLNGKRYTLDLGINRFENDINNNSDFYSVGRVIDVGDLSTYYGYETFNAEGFEIVPGRTLPDVVENSSDMTYEKALALLKQGYTSVMLRDEIEEDYVPPFPLNVVSEIGENPTFNLNIGVNPTFLLQKNGMVEYAVINGFLIDFKTKTGTFKNAVIQD